jgi:hypothetical protein
MGKTPEQIERTKKIYAEKFGHIPTFQLKDIDRPDESNLKLQVMDDFSRYELTRMRPNYGSFSDVLRYRLLYQYGGGYFDSDVKPGIISFEDLVARNKDSTEHLLFLDTNSQDSHNIGNDSIVCTKANPLIKQIYDNAKHHYVYKTQAEETSHHIALMGIYNALPQQLFLYDDNAEQGYIFKSTPVKTGNVCIQIVVDNLGKTNAEITADSDQIRCLEGCTTHTPNYTAWVNMPIEQMEEKVALKKISDSMQFEAEKLGILRLDDHINNFVTASSEERRSEGMEKIFELAKKIDLKSLNGVQLTFENPKAVEFCNQHGLLEKTFLFPSSASCKTICSDTNYFQKAIKMLFEIDLFRSIVPMLTDDPASVDKTIEAVVKRCVAIDLFSDVAMDYCSMLSKPSLWRSKAAEAEIKHNIAEDYLKFLVAYTREIQSQLEETYKKLTDVQAKEVIQSCQTLLIHMHTKLLEYADRNDFKFVEGQPKNTQRIS